MKWDRSFTLGLLSISMLTACQNNSLSGHSPTLNINTKISQKDTIQVEIQAPQHFQVKSLRASDISAFKMYVLGEEIGKVFNEEGLVPFDSQQGTQLSTSLEPKGRNKWRVVAAIPYDANGNEMNYGALYGFYFAKPGFERVVLNLKFGATGRLLEKLISNDSSYLSNFNPQVFQAQLEDYLERNNLSIASTRLDPDLLEQAITSQAQLDQDKLSTLLNKAQEFESFDVHVRDYAGNVLSKDLALELSIRINDPTSLVVPFPLGEKAVKIEHVNPALANSQWDIIASIDSMKEIESRGRISYDSEGKASVEIGNELNPITLEVPARLESVKMMYPTVGNESFVQLEGKYLNDLYNRESLSKQESYYDLTLDSKSFSKMEVALNTQNMMPGLHDFSLMSSQKFRTAKQDVQLYQGIQPVLVADDNDLEGAKLLETLKEPSSISYAPNQDIYACDNSNRICLHYAQASKTWSRILGGKQELAEMAIGENTLFSDLATLNSIQFTSDGHMFVHSGNAIGFQPAVNGLYFGKEMKSGFVYKLHGNTKEMLEIGSMDFDSKLNLYFSDISKHQIFAIANSKGNLLGKDIGAGEWIDLSAKQSEKIPLSTGDGDIISKAQFNYPLGLVVDKLGKFGPTNSLIVSECGSLNSGDGFNGVRIVNSQTAEVNRLIGSGRSNKEVAEAASKSPTGLVKLNEEILASNKDREAILSEIYSSQKLFTSPKAGEKIRLQLVDSFLKYEESNSKLRELLATRESIASELDSKLSASTVDMNCPVSLALSTQALYIADAGNHRILEYQAQSKALKAIVGMRQEEQGNLPEFKRSADIYRVPGRSMNRSAYEGATYKVSPFALSLSSAGYLGYADLMENGSFGLSQLAAPVDKQMALSTGVPLITAKIAP